MKRTRIDRFKVRNRMPNAPRQITTFEELAKAANISQTTIYSAIDSYSWRAATLDAIANALGCCSMDILTIDGEDEQTRLEAARSARKGR